MNAKAKTILSVIVPLIILGTIITVYYMRQNGNIKNTPSDFKLSSKAINKEFLINDSVANATYSNKIVELTGVIAGIKNSEMHGIVITFDDPVMGVKCVMDSTIKTLPEDVAIGSTVSIKGVMIGLDQMIGVMMNQCVITNKETVTP